MSPRIPVSMTPTAGGGTILLVLALLLGVTAIVVRHVIKQANGSDQKAAPPRYPN